MQPWVFNVVESTGGCTLAESLSIWLWLFKDWIALLTEQISIRWIAQYVLLTLIHWTAIYPFDSVIRPLNNWSLKDLSRE